MRTPKRSLTAPAIRKLAAEIEGSSATGEALAHVVQLGTAVTLRWLKLLAKSRLVDGERAGPITPCAASRIAKPCAPTPAVIVAADL